MISGLLGSGNVQIAGGQASIPYISINYNEQNPMTGMVRVNGSTLEAYNGSSWIKFTQPYATVALSGSAESAINWAMHQERKEKEREELIKNNPALQKAYEAIKRAEENFDLLSKFVEHDKDDEEMSVSASP